MPIRPAATQIDESKMSFKCACAAAIAGSTLCGVMQADAGYWNYGCKGNLGDTAPHSSSTATRC